MPIPKLRWGHGIRYRIYTWMCQLNRLMAILKCESPIAEQNNKDTGFILIIESKGMTTIGEEDS